MKLFDVFKKKKTQEPEKKVERPKNKIKIPSRDKPVARAKPKKNLDTAWRILRFPHITEKATGLIKKNQYIFRVWPQANKIEIKKAIKNIYGVEATGVKIIKIPSKKRRLGRITGRRKGYKKAIIKIKKGQKIEVLA